MGGGLRWSCIHHSHTDSSVCLGSADGVAQAGPATTLEDGLSIASQAAGPPVSDGRRMDHAGSGHADPRADSSQYAPSPHRAAGAGTATAGTDGSAHRTACRRYGTWGQRGICDQR
jgi:hypothetical protein